VDELDVGIMKTVVTTSDFLTRASALIGLPISRAWKGYGSTVFLELGDLLYSETHPKGVSEASISIDWDWRIEGESKIICGSSNSGPEIANHLAMFEGETVKELVLDGSPHELILTISNGRRLRSMSMVTGSPQWSIRFSDGIWFSCEEDELFASDGTHSEGMTKEEERVCSLAKVASKRWGTPVIEPKPGYCGSCQYYVRLDGSFYFLDYGVCSSSRSAFDGKVTNVKSGCPEHAESE
jgi:hypothetical protein